jgi:alanine dehydrogenase
MGAQVIIMDIKEPSLSYLDEIYQGRIQTLYASEQNILKEVQEADLIIGAVLIPGGKTPQLVKKSVLKLMKPGAVIVDVAVDQGGCVETSRPTTHDDPIFEVDGIVHYCVSNMPGVVSLTSTRALTAQTLSYAKLIAREGLDKALEQNSALRHALNLRAGEIVHPALK